MKEIDRFVQWLSKQPRISDSTVKKYYRAIVTISGELSAKGLLLDESLYKVNNFHKLEELKAKYLAVPQFAQKNKTGQHMYSCAMDYYIRYIKENHVETIITSPDLTIDYKCTDNNSKMLEGKVVQVLVDKYERSSTARSACIANKGCTCLVCGFDFKNKYGTVADGYIHVHHLRPISSTDTEYEIDPTKELVPVCPNCHSVIHMKNPPYTIEEVIEILKIAQQSTGQA